MFLHHTFGTYILIDSYSYYLCILLFAITCQISYKFFWYPLTNFHHMNIFYRFLLFVSPGLNKMFTWLNSATTWFSQMLDQIYMKKNWSISIHRLQTNRFGPGYGSTVLIFWPNLRTNCVAEENAIEYKRIKLLNLVSNKRESNVSNVKSTLKWVCTDMVAWLKEILWNSNVYCQYNMMAKDLFEMLPPLVVGLAVFYVE